MAIRELLLPEDLLGDVEKLLKELKENYDKKEQKKDIEPTLEELIDEHKKVQSLTASSKISWADIIIEGRREYGTGVKTEDVGQRTVSGRSFNE